MIPSTLITSFFAALLVAQAEGQRRGVQKPAEAPKPGIPTSQGCFSAEGQWEDPESYDPRSVTVGFCERDVCGKLNTTVYAVKGSKCYCGDKYPPAEAKVDDSKCNYECPGYPFEACGGIQGGQYWSVFNSGIEVVVEHVEPEASTSAPASGSPTDGSSSDSDKDDSGGSTNVGAIVGGVVVAVVAIAGSIGGVFFYLRRKRNKEIEEEHRRNAAVNSFIGHKPPSSSGGLSISDSRLDPVMAQRRMSDGSIADNQDYSRRILRVMNA